MTSADGPAYRTAVEVSLPVRSVPGWRPLEFPLGLWSAPKRFPGVGARPEETNDHEMPPWWSDVHALLLQQITWLWYW